jgi:oligopeptide transport system ATP-binding protein
VGVLERETGVTDTIEVPVQPILSIDRLGHRYSVGHGPLGMRRGYVAAVNDISFTIDHGETFGLVGESGCGKTTTARVILRIENPQTGTIRFNGTDIGALSGGSLKEYRSHVQAVLQDPYSALNPRMTIGSIISEPLEAHRRGDRHAQDERVRETLEMVGLPAAYRDYLPHQLSGGQRQRVAIARSLVLAPRLIVLDEPVSALDMSIRSQILNLLRQIQRVTDVSYLMIAHDLGSVLNLSHRVGVMYLGQMMEIAPSAAYFEGPRHPYSQALFLASRFDTLGKSWTPPVDGELPSPLDPPSGCPFHPRCPQAFARCAVERPRWLELTPNHYVACHLYDEPLVESGR